MNKIEAIKEFEVFANSQMGAEEVLSLAKKYCQYGNVTLAEAINSYRKYIIWWKANFGDRELKYISKDDRQVPFYQFCLEEMYNNSYKLGNTNLDAYIFGSEDMYKLDEKVSKINKEMGL